jgi:S-adenosyl methyltransferase
VHEIAQDIAPQARVVYVDNDPIVLTHARALLGNTETTRVITADLRRPEEILRSPAVRDFVDLSRPIGLLLFAILHHINDADDPGGIAARLRSVMTPGSYLAISHFCNPGAAYPEDAARADMCEKIFNEKLGTGRWRTVEEIGSYFGDLTPVEPGLVPLPEWRPEPDDDLTVHPTYRLFVGGVAGKG